MDGDKQNGMKNNQINNNREGYEIKKITNKMIAAPV